MAVGILFFASIRYDSCTTIRSLVPRKHSGSIFSGFSMKTCFSSSWISLTLFSGHISSRLQVILETGLNKTPFFPAIE
jgi:hypothetical protein